VNPLAQKANDTIIASNPYIVDMLSDVGKELYFPRGILTQGAEAKEKAHAINATIGIATGKEGVLYFPSVMECIPGIIADEALPYASSYGIPDLRKLWKEELLQKNPSLRDKIITSPVVTCGITHGLSIFADLWINPGDTLILPKMMWGNYQLLFGVRKRANITFYPVYTDDLKFDVDGFAQKIREEAAKNDKIVVLLNFPHNPSGYTASVKEAQKMADVLIEVAKNGTNVVVVCDDAYFGLFFDAETEKESLFAKLCGQHERLMPVKLDGGTKENFIWGLRVGFITHGIIGKGDMAAAATALEAKTGGCVRGMISNASHLSQRILLKSMKNQTYLKEKQEKFEILEKRANCVRKVLENPKYQTAWDVYPFNSGYFMCLRLKKTDAEKTRLYLLDKYGIGLISMGEKDLRIAFSCVEEKDIPALFDTIFQAIEEMNPS